MRADQDGLPKLGRSASCLGIRVLRESGRIDIPVRDGYVDPATGGMSVSPDDWHHIHPTMLDSLADREGFHVWCLMEHDLGPNLAYVADERQPAVHGFVEPVRRMRLEDYEGSLEATRASWRLYSIEPEAEE
jgi:hypothetical protein